MTNLTVDGIGKRYNLGGGSDEGSAFALGRRLRQFLGRRAAQGDATGGRKEFWALKDVSFTVEPGTVLGLIGANGAGKTTLLKILARVTTPTEGRVAGAGRVVSLLELGAGFEPDLTARENILLNAAMLGIPRAVVMRRFDAIVEFAGVDKFVDTPLKHYSSGMYLRLAFSVAINMEPSILLADEILAVGDQDFQERCLARVQEEAARGLTVLFVSHDMEAIVRLCNRTLWLHAGRVMGTGDSDDIIAEYQNSVYARGISGTERGRHGNRHAVIHDVRMVTEDGREVRGVQTDQVTYLRMRFEMREKGLYGRPAFDVRVRGQLVFRSTDSEDRIFRKPGMWEARMRVPAHFFNETTYTVVPSLAVHRRHEDARRYSLIGEPLSFIVYGPDDGARAEKPAREARAGFLAPAFEWTFERQEQPLVEDEPDVART
jgi:lipopolysaccharide transport system ATP-binding protein